MSPTTRVAAWQCLPWSRDVAGNLRRLDAICASAAAQRAEVLVTPEMFTSGYAITPADVLRHAEDAGGPTEAAVAQIARRHHLAIVYGHPERAADGGVYNAATMIGPDGVVRGRHRKVHLFGNLDRAQFVANSEPPAAFDFDGSRVGMLICYDVEFPEAVRSLAVDGARAVFVPTANMTGCEEVQDVLVRARQDRRDAGADRVALDQRGVADGDARHVGDGVVLAGAAGQREAQFTCAHRIPPGHSGWRQPRRPTAGARPLRR